MIYTKKYLLFIFIFIISILFTSCLPKSNVVKFHYIDVGQGDATLIQAKSTNILIDSGPNSSEEKILAYLKKHRIKSIDYLIGTHPHEDHIGNMDAIISNVNVENFLAPKITYDSKDFNNLLNILKEKKLKITPLDAGDIINTDNLTLEIFSPTKDTYSDLNDYSPIMKITHDKNSFLFTGDAEEVAEMEVLNKDIDTDVLKVGHHGSSSSSSTKFLEKVTPKISIISCGINNKFNHPHLQTIKTLNDINSQIYRTDEDGTIILISDGAKIQKR